MGGCKEDAWGLGEAVSVRPKHALTMLASARSVDCTCVWFVFSNRSLASKMSWGFTPYLVTALMKLPMFSSCKEECQGDCWGAQGRGEGREGYSGFWGSPGASSGSIR